MDLQIIKELDIDFSIQKYISLNMKQYDRNTRFILITCYNQGELIPINNNTCFACIRYRKPDGNGVFNTCEITNEGKVLIKITEQMLSVSGVAYTDLAIYEVTDANVEINESSIPKIIETGDCSILSTMSFYININESAIDSDNIESSYEYNALNEALLESKRNYENVINTCYNYKNEAKKSATSAKSYALGGTNSRNNEDIDNASYYYNQLKDVIYGLNSIFIPMGTITFSELSKAEKSTGYLYNISDDFTTNNTFKCGSGKKFPAGTNVFYTADNYWSCLSINNSSFVSINDIATLKEVKEYLKI